MKQRNSLLLLLSIFVVASSFIVYNGHRGTIVTRPFQGNKIEFFAPDPDTLYYTDSQTHRQMISIKTTEWTAVRLNGLPVLFNESDTLPAYPPAVKLAANGLYAKVNALIQPRIMAMGDGMYYAAAINVIYDQQGRIAFYDHEGDFTLYPSDNTKRQQAQQQKPLLDSLLLSSIKSTEPFPVVMLHGQALPYELTIMIEYRVKNGKLQKVPVAFK